MVHVELDREAVNHLKAYQLALSMVDDKDAETYGEAIEQLVQESDHSEAIMAFLEQLQDDN